MSADALLIGAHPDDIEIGMGGTAAALSRAGYSVVGVDLTDGEPTPHGSPQVRAKESSKAGDILGFARRITLPNTNRELFDTVPIRNQIASLIREYKPALLFIPYWDDAHPDHVYAHDLSIAARFYSKFVKSDLPHTPHLPKKVIYYFSLHFRLHYSPTFLFDISQTADTKFQALEAYESQFKLNIANQDFLNKLKTENAYWGDRVGVTFAEPFICKEQIAIKSPKDLFEI